MISDQNERIVERKYYKIAFNMDTGSQVDLADVTEIRWGFGEVEKSIGDGIEIVNNQQFTAEIFPDDTDGMGGGSYSHEGKIISAEGNPSSVVKGNITIEKSRF